MARRLGRRKEPSREKVLLKERELAEGGLNKRVAVYLSKFYNKGVIDGIGTVFAKGKESDIYVASPGTADIVKGEPYVIVKMFRVQNSSFFSMEDYIIGDPRFKKIGRTKQEIIGTWCKKEFGNLEIAQFAGIAAPKPYMYNGNILAMQYIGTDDGPAPRLVDAGLDRTEAESMLRTIIDYTKRLHRRGLVHGDLSEYNILVHGDKPYFIDFGQAVVTRHPHAEEFLKRDVWNVVNYFRKAYGAAMTVDEAYAEVAAAGPRQQSRP